MNIHTQKLRQLENIRTDVNIFTSLLICTIYPFFSDLDQAVIQHYYHIQAAVLQNTRIIDKNNNWSQVCFLNYTSREGIPCSMSASKLLKNLFFSGNFNTFPFVSVVYFSAVRLITFVGSLTIQHTAVHVFHSLLINSCFDDRILPL